VLDGMPAKKIRHGCRQASLTPRNIVGRQARHHEMWSQWSRVYLRCKCHFCLHPVSSRVSFFRAQAAYTKEHGISGGRISRDFGSTHRLWCWWHQAVSGRPL
jgi:hypothetical protein